MYDVVVCGMPARSGAAHVVTTRRHRGEKTYQAHLLMRSYREGGKVRKETLANLTALGDDGVELVRAFLQGKQVAVIEDVFETRESKLHGHVQAVLTAMRRLGFERLLASRASRERSLVMALVAYRLLDPRSKLATSRAWSSTSLPAELGLGEVSEDELYSAMDWLVARRERIEGKLASRHLGEGERVLFDLTSSYVEGSHCKLAELGYSRDERRGKKQVNWGLLASREGIPVALDVFPGNTADPKTLLPQVVKLRERFGIESFTLVGDRGMISGKHIEVLARLPGVQWITALKSTSIRPLLASGVIQPSLFDERNMFELSHPDYPGERLVACHNPVLARQRAHKRHDLIDATVTGLEKIRKSVEKGRLKGEGKIALKVGKILGKYQVAKHIDLEVTEDTLNYQVNEQRVAEEAALDGIYVIRTSVGEEELSAADAVRAYKDLSQLEDAFKIFKGIDLKARPFHHRLEDRIKAHLFICLLAYYVRWHMARAWASLTFKDEQPASGNDRDPVAPAERSESAKEKAQTGTLPTSERAHSFKTLLDSLTTIVKNTHCFPGQPERTFTSTTTPNPQQQHALNLLNTIK
jgi:transposase